MKIRCSTLPLFMSCANTVLNPDILMRIEKEFEAAEVGTLIHRLAEDYILTGEADPNKYKERLTELDGLDRAFELMPHIKHVWDRTAQVIDEPAVEQYLEARINPDDHAPGAEIIITGHIDVNQIKGDTAYILDWKTGRVRDDHYHQVAGYAYLIWYNNPGLTTVHATVCYAEDGGLYRYTFTSEQLIEWARDVTEQASNQRYVVNRRCVNCPLSRDCEAFGKYRSTAVATVTNTSAPSLRDMSEEDRAAAIIKLKVVEDAVKDFRAMIKDDVRANGPMDTGDGREFKIVTSSTRKLNTGRALDPLEQHVTPKELLDASTISLPQLEKAVSKRADKGNKAQAIADMVADLDTAKAIFTVKSERLECRKKPKQIT